MSPPPTKSVKSTILRMFSECATILSVVVDIFAVLYALFAEDSYTVLPDLALLTQGLYSITTFAISVSRKSEVFIHKGCLYAPTSVRNQWKILGLCSLITQSVLSNLMLFSGTQYEGYSESGSMFLNIFPMIPNALMVLWTTACAYSHDDLLHILIKETQQLCKEYVARTDESQFVSN